MGIILVIIIKRFELFIWHEKQIKTNKIKRLLNRNQINEKIFVYKRSKNWVLNHSAFSQFDLWPKGMSKVSSHWKTIKFVKNLFEINSYIFWIEDTFDWNFNLENVWRIKGLKSFRILLKFIQILFQFLFVSALIGCCKCQGYGGGGGGGAAGYGGGGGGMRPGGGYGGNGGMRGGGGGYGGMAGGRGGYGAGAGIGGGFGAGVGMGVGGGAGAGAGEAVQAAIISRHNIEYRNVPSSGMANPVTVEVGSSPIPVNFLFRSSSSNLNVQQQHEGSQGSTQQSSSEDEPHRLIHEVTKPIIQEVREVISPFRRIVQEINPVQEDIQTIVSRDQGGGGGAGAGANGMGGGGIGGYGAGGRGIGGIGGMNGYGGARMGGMGGMGGIRGGGGAYGGGGGGTGGKAYWKHEY